MAVFIIILCTFAFSFTFLQQSIQLLEILNGTGYEAYALVNPVMMYCSMTLIFIISQSIITTETNTDFLLSLPIKKTSIICAKTITTTFLHFCIGLILIVPTTFCYISTVNSSYLILLSIITLIFFISILITGFGYLYNTFLNFFVIRIRGYKIFRGFIVLLSLLLFLYGYTAMFTSSVGLEIFFFTDLIKAVINNDMLFLILLYSTSFLILIIGTIVFSKLYGKKPKMYLSKDQSLSYTNNSQLSSLVKKEFRNYINSSMYLFNTIIGYIIIIGASIYLLFASNSLNDTLPHIIYLVGCFSLSVSCTTNSSISLEGKNLWIVKSTPVNPKLVLTSKVLMNIIMLLFTLTLSFVFIIASHKVSINIALLLYLLSILNAIFICFGGLIINLLLPKLDFKNEMAVVKQSASAIISILFFMVFLSTPAFLYMFEIIKIDFILLLTLNVIYILILDLLLILFTYTKGVKLFKKLQ